MKHGYSCFPGIVGRFISEHSNAISVMNSTLKPFIDKDDIDNNTIKNEFKGLNFPNYKNNLRYDYFKILCQLEPNTNFPTSKNLEVILDNFYHI